MKNKKKSLFQRITYAHRPSAITEANLTPPPSTQPSSAQPENSNPPNGAVLMEDSSAQRQNLALNPSNTNYTFPPHRRRPLRSRTYRALIGIMSHSRVDSTHLQKQVDSDDSVLRPAFQENRLTARNEVKSVDVLAPDPNSKVPEDTLVQETTVGENREKICFQDGVIDCINTTESKVDHVKVVKDVEHEGSRNLSVVENQMDDFDFHVSKDQENANGVDIQMEGLEVDKDFCIGDFSEALDSCFDMDTVVELSKSGEEGQENRMVLEENKPKETECQLKVKEMELEKLVHNSAVVEPSCCLNADGDMEEGEISGEDEFVDAPFDALSKFAVHASDGSFDKEKDICNNEDRGRETTDPSLVNVVNSDTDFMEVESITPFGKMQENAAEDQICATTEKDQDLGKKKRKKGPLTKERRAKKKKKERIKRAEKNREDGVRRANPQPIIKPKKISECRHYKYGRCYEGEKCKFSHDTVPLTKSTPCAYFARNSCMKGKDCPFDHELSKYPCTKYITDNSCPRGSNCSFSHEKPAKQNFSITPNTSSVPELTSPQHTVPDKRRSSTESKATKPELKFSTPPNNTNTIKQTDNYGIHHQRSNGKSTDPLPMNPVTRTVRQPPRGVSFLSTGEKSSGESSKHKVGEPSVKTTNGVDAGCKTSLDKSNEMSEKVAPRKPRGINFLSFAQPSSDNSSSNIFSNLPLSNSKSGTSVINGTNEGKLTSSLLENDGALKANRQDTIQIPSLSFGGQNSHFSSSFKTSLLSNTPSSVQNAIQSTLAFAEKFEPDIKVGSYLNQLRS